MLNVSCKHYCNISIFVDYKLYRIILRPVIFDVLNVILYCFVIILSSAVCYARLFDNIIVIN